MKKINWILLLSGLALANISWAGAILSIVPSITSVTTRSDSETTLTYTITNNAAISIRGLKLNLGYQTTGNAAGFSTQNDGCSNITIAPKASCQFGLVIQGANQPNTFVITPEVTGNNGQVRSYVGTTGAVTTHVYSATNVPFAYFPLNYNASSASVSHDRLGFPVSNAIVSMNTSNNNFGTPVTGLHFTDIVLPHLNSPASSASIAVSLDGSRVYAAETPNADMPNNTADIAVLSGGANGQLLQRIPLASTTQDGIRFFVAITPDDTKLYVTATDGGIFNQVYVVNLTSGQASLLAGDFASSSGVAISPDGKLAYIVNSTGGNDGMGGVSIVNIATNTVVNTLSNATSPGIFDTPSKLAVSPDGTKLFMKNVSDIAVFTIGTDGSYTYQSSINSIPDPSGLVVSNDSNSLYVTSSTSSNIYKVNTGNITNITVISGSNPANSGLSITPNDAALFIAPEAGGSNPQVLNNLSTTPTSAIIDVAGVLNSATALGNFANFVN